MNWNLVAPVALLLIIGLAVGIPVGMLIERRRKDSSLPTSQRLAAFISTLRDHWLALTCWFAVWGGATYGLANLPQLQQGLGQVTAVGEPGTLLLTASILAVVPGWIFLRLTPTEGFRHEVRNQKLAATMYLAMLMVSLQAGAYVMSVNKVRQAERLAWASHDWQFLAIALLLSALTVLLLAGSVLLIRKISGRKELEEMFHTRG